MQVTDFEALKGRGARARVDGRTDYVGGPRLLEQLDQEPPASLGESTRDAEVKGQTVIYLVRENQVVAGFALADVIRPGSQCTVEDLHRMGIQVGMLSGDS